MAATAPATTSHKMAAPSHLVTAPRWTLGLRAAQIFLGVIILGLVSYSASKVKVYSVGWPLYDSGVSVADETA